MGPPSSTSNPFAMRKSHSVDVVAPPSMFRDVIVTGVDPMVNRYNPNAVIVGRHAAFPSLHDARRPRGGGDGGGGRGDDDGDRTGVTALHNLWMVGAVEHDAAPQTKQRGKHKGHHPSGGKGSSKKEQRKAHVQRKKQGPISSSLVDRLAQLEIQENLVRRRGGLSPGSCLVSACLLEPHSISDAMSVSK